MTIYIELIEAYKIKSSAYNNLAVDSMFAGKSLLKHRIILREQEHFLGLSPPDVTQVVLLAPH